MEICHAKYVLAIPETCPSVLECARTFSTDGSLVPVDSIMGAIRLDGVSIDMEYPLACIALLQAEQGSHQLIVDMHYTTSSAGTVEPHSAFMVYIDTSLAFHYLREGGTLIICSLVDASVGKHLLYEHCGEEWEISEDESSGAIQLASKAVNSQMLVARFNDTTISVDAVLENSRSELENMYLSLRLLLEISGLVRQDVLALAWTLSE